MALIYPEKHIGKIIYGTKIISFEKTDSGFLFKCLCVCGDIVFFKTPYIQKRSGCRTCSPAMFGRRFSEKGPFWKVLLKKWKSMIFRCENPKDKSYVNYGGRGIVVCDEWRKDFNSFFKWAIETGFQKNLTIERIDVNGSYSPLNCKWATKLEQNNNTRNNVFFEMDGERLTKGDWARRYGKTRAQVDSRVRIGWSFEDAVKTPMNPRNGNCGNYR
jgi:hypothetical protein